MDPSAAGRRPLPWVLGLCLTSLLACHAGPAPAALALSEAGDRLGPLGADTPFDAAEIRALLPSHTVMEDRGYTEGEAFPVLRVLHGGEGTLELRSADGARIHSVEILPGAPIANLPARHGARFADVYPAGSESCAAGVEEASGLVLCSAPALPQLLLVFDGAWDGPDGVLPPRDVLASWTVERMIWGP